jgi:hypothetical protein
MVCAVGGRNAQAQAQARLDEIRRVQQVQDWIAVHDARHPAPLLRFLRTHPRGVRAAEAVELLASLERTVEEEAWSEVKDSDEPILFKAYLAALPHRRNAEAAQAQLRRLAVDGAATATGVTTRTRHPRARRPKNSRHVARTPSSSSRK